MLFDVHLASSEQLRKRKFALGLINRLASGEKVNPFTVVTSSGMSAHGSRIISKSECATWLEKYLNSMSSKTILLDHSKCWYFSVRQ